MNVKLIFVFLIDHRINVKYYIINKKHNKHI